jgi:hypothetical protein
MDLVLRTDSPSQAVPAALSSNNFASSQRTTRRTVLLYFPIFLLRLIASKITSKSRPGKSAIVLQNVQSLDHVDRAFGAMR